MSTATRGRDREAIGRGAALRIFGGIGGAFALGTYGGVVSAASTTAASTIASAATDAACAVTPEGEIGPYFADDGAAGLRRSDIRSNLDGSDSQSGVPLTLNIYVRDSESTCAPLKGARVDVWHCNAYGAYSDEFALGTSGRTWLRGYQVTEPSGLVTFKTIVPGWYAGRATHIHLKVRSKYDEGGADDEKNTTQLFFSQALIDHLNAHVAPYNTRAAGATTNANDHVYESETKGETKLSLTGNDTSGFRSTFAIHLPIT